MVEGAVDFVGEDGDLPGLGECDYLGEDGSGGCAACWVVGVVDYDELGGC